MSPLRIGKRASSALGGRRTHPRDDGAGRCAQATDPSRRVVVIPGTRALSPMPYANRLSRLSVP